MCDEQRCEEQVFPLAINYLDRFLCQCPISRQQFQLLGAVCLLLATKIRQCYALTADLLCAYTDFSVTPEEIRVSKNKKRVLKVFLTNYYITNAEMN